MTTSRSALGGIAFTLAFLGISIAPGRAEEAVDSVPRYELTPGQELSYRSQSEFKYKDGSFGNKADWQVWVLRKNEDGSFRMLFRSSERTVQSSSGREAREQPADVSMGYADLFPDGRFVPNDSWGYRLNPTPLFPKLPADVGELKSGWTGTNPRDDSRTAYQVASPADEGPTGWLFEGVRTTPLDKIYMFTDRSKNHFDRKKGLVTRIENENSQGYGFEGKGSGTTELTAIERRDDVWVKSLAEESDVYFAATKACGDLQKKASHDPAQAETLLAQAETTLKAAREKVRLPILRTQFDEQLKMQKATPSITPRRPRNARRSWAARPPTGRRRTLKARRTPSRTIGVRSSSSTSGIEAAAGASGRCPRSCSSPTTSKTSRWRSLG